MSQQRIDAQRFQRALQHRRARYPLRTVSAREHAVAEALTVDGYAVVRQAFPTTLLSALRCEMAVQLGLGTHVRETAGGRFRQVSQPLLHCPVAAIVAFDQRLIDIAQAYLGCVPAVGTANLRESLVTGLPEAETLLYHRDPNSPRFLKFFFYLTDVDEDTGPLCYAQGSHRDQYARGAPYRREIAEVETYYGPRIKRLTGSVGDLIVADTTGLHRGSKVRSAERWMFTVNYVVHPEQWKAPQFKIRHSFVEALPEHKKPVANFLVRVADPGDLGPC